MLIGGILTLAISIGALQAPEPSEANFTHWREYLRPKPSELGFEDTRWKPTFWEAVVESQQTARPILLWAMNGHPLACT
jgi:hypothetical protein